MMVSGVQPESCAAQTKVKQPLRPRRESDPLVCYETSVDSFTFIHRPLKKLFSAWPTPLLKACIPRASCSMTESV